MTNLNATRDSRLDALRGLFLIVMTIDHLPCGLFHYTNEPLGFVSAAEGFVFLSGLVAAKSYGKSFLQSGHELARQRVMRRVAILYGYHLLTYAVLLLGVLAGFLKRDYFAGWLPLFFDQPGLSALLGPVLLYQPTFLDILPLYCLLLLPVPFVLGLLHRNRIWHVIGLSAGLWGLNQSGLSRIMEAQLGKFGFVNLGTFDVLGWQLLFILGMVFGFPGASLPPFKVGRRMTAVAVTVAVVFVILRYDLLFPSSDWAVHFAAKESLGTFRVLNFIALAVLVRAGLRMINGPMHLPLAYLGRHSLQVFTFHILVVYFATAVLDSRLELPFLLPIISSLYIPAYLCERYRPPLQPLVRPDSPSRSEANVETLNG